MNIHYDKELESFVKSKDLSFLKNKNILITGASGLIGSYLVDVLMKSNYENKSNIKIYAVVRNYIKAEKRFSNYISDIDFNLILADVSKPFELDYDVDYIIHAASNANPQAFDEDPIGTIKANVNGTLSLLEYAQNKGAQFLYLSSSEVYGEPVEKSKVFREDDLGLVNPLSPRSCYTESKRLAENICINYAKQYGVHTNIARIGFAYGPTFTESDNRVIPQFIRSGLNDEFILMKSTGDLVRSYIYLYDVASAIFTILNKGSFAETYNISNSNSNVSIRDIANAVSNATGKEIRLDLPKFEKNKGYSPFSVGLLCSNKLEKLGWKSEYTIDEGIKQIIRILG